MANGPLAAQAMVIERAAALLATNPAKAKREAETILKLAPRDPRALLILGSALRRLNDLKAAKAVLKPLAEAYPRAANTAYELGLVLAALGDAAGAERALHHAVSLNPDLADAWRALGELLFTRGDAAGAEAAFDQHRRAVVTDPALKGAAEAVFRGDLEAAEQALRTHLLRHLDDATATRMLGELYIRQARNADAEILLARCLELDPQHIGARFSYADALFKQQKAAQAMVEVERLLALAPDDAAYLNLYAACLGLVGEDARVLEIYERLSSAYPNQPRLWLNYGHALRAVGRRADAVAAYQRCLALAPGLGDAYWSLANLKVASFSADQEAAMRGQLARPDLAAEDRLHLHYALGKALEDGGDYQASFEHYAQGASIRRGQIHYDPAQTTALTSKSKALFTPGFFAERAAWGAPSDAPIFILGLPRSGSTLIEQILASHSAVEGTMELPQLGLIANGQGSDGLARAGRFYPEAAADLDRDAAARLGEHYVEATRIYRKLDRPRFIDKMPPNFQYAPLIHLILPNARIIDARRHPLGSCFSAFKQHFAQGQAFSYDLGDLGLYYRDYVDLMRHLDAVLPGRVHRVIYEDLVDDTETQVRHLLDYCGLPFEAACLRFHENSRTVRTVSSEQVRRPIFRDGLEQWRRYEPWLDPLKAALGPALDAWRD